MRKDVWIFGVTAFIIDHKQLNKARFRVCITEEHRKNINQSDNQTVAMLSTTLFRNLFIFYIGPCNSLHLNLPKVYP